MIIHTHTGKRQAHARTGSRQARTRSRWRCDDDNGFVGLWLNRWIRGGGVTQEEMDIIIYFLGTKIYHTLGLYNRLTIAFDVINILLNM